MNIQEQKHFPRNPDDPASPLETVSRSLKAAKEDHCARVEQGDRPLTLSYGTTTTLFINNAPSFTIVICLFDGLFVCCSTFKDAAIC